MREQAANSLAPEIRARLWSDADPFDRPFLAGIFARIPHHIAPRLLTEWEARLDSQGRRESNLYALSLKTDLLPELFPDTGLAFDATDDEIADAAERAVRRVRERLRLVEMAGEDKIVAALARVTRPYRVEMPRCKTLAGIIARMTEPRWWRRALRKRFQVVEHAAIRAGCVSRRAAVYVSDEACRRHERHMRKMAKLLDELEAVNMDTGEALSLAELASRSLANPANRRIAMMVCIRGLEEYAKGRGYVGLMVTITCPSRMHACDAATGKVNPSYDGTSPRMAKNYLCRLWNSATRKLQRTDIDHFGVRVAEPHHDATPHFHVLAFVPPLREAEFIATLRDYALRDSPGEPGADLHRFNVKRIDPKKGSAAGYIAKYVSKNLDGHGVGDDLEGGGDARTTAPRAVVWSRLWHARQFQFFGAGAVTPFREMFRLDHIPEALEPLLGDLWRAAKAGDFGAFVRARNARAMKLAILYKDAPSKCYSGEIVKRLRGIVVHADAGPLPIVTRPDEWEIRPRERPERPERERASEGFAVPWTRFNNSARVDYRAFFRLSEVSNRTPRSGRTKRVGAGNRPEPGTATQLGASL